MPSFNNDDRKLHSTLITCNMKTLQKNKSMLSVILAAENIYHCQGLLDLVCDVLSNGAYQTTTKCKAYNNKHLFITCISASQLNWTHDIWESAGQLEPLSWEFGESFLQHILLMSSEAQEGKPTAQKTSIP